MTNFAETLASYIRGKVMDATSGREGARLETRFIFHGSPLSLLSAVFESLVTKGGIEVCNADGVSFTLPVLLQAPSSSGRIRNPVIGQSGLCDEGHLLHLRNDPHSPSFVALVPPGQHNNKSVASTTDEFGVGVQSNTSHAPFDEWWGDEFIQWLLTKALEGIGLAGEDSGEARDLAKQAAEAVDDVEGGDGTRSAAWLLLSRLFSIPSGGLDMTPWQAVALACGMPSSPSRPSAKALQDVLGQVAATLADGFGTGIAQLKQGAADDISQALDQFLAHLRDRCDVPTAFERATPAFYLPDAGAQVQPPPSWWGLLTAEKWLELMAEEPLEVGDLHIECTNSIFPIGRGMPAIVRGDAAVSVSARGTGGDGLRVVSLERSSGSARTKRVVELDADKDGKFLYLDDQVPAHKASITYKAVAQDFKAASIKVISLEHWSPGILVCCRLASKLSPPKKPARKAATGPDLETTLLLPGAGRYELVVFVSQDISIERVTGIADDATEVEEGHTELKAIAVKDGEYQVEIDADAKYQVDISYRRAGGVVETCRLNVTCADATEEGCRSEFERLIKLNRKHLERFDAKSVVQLDRHARISSLQSWLLDDQNVALSFRPLVLADDYAEAWAPPDWTKDGGTIMSKGQFLHDPRPDPALFDPAQKFVDARREIARLVRETDEQSGLLESAQLGAWLARKPEFRELIENYLDSYSAWLSSEPDVACWVDVVAVASMEADGRTLSRIPDAILLSPLHPLRLAWHCVAQRVLFDAAEGESPLPCPAASVLDPDCVPDVLTLSLQAPGGLDQQDFISVECSSDYWSVLWNGKRLRQLAERCRKPPFDDAFGITVGGISSSFSSAQVARALEDVSDLLAAKPVVNLVVSSAGGATDSCNEGLVDWCARRFGNGSSASGMTGVGPRMLEVFDTRQSSSRPDEATIANLAEDTRGLVRWFNKQPDDAKPDLGIIAQLDSAEPDSTGVGMRSPLGLGGLIRHRVRRQLPGAFLSESRQGRQMPPSGDVLADKVLACMLAIECRHDGRTGLRFAPNVHAVKDMLEGKKADFVAVSSSAIDPACFLAGWINGAYLWDYDLPAYSSRAGDTSGYYLLSKVKEADRDGLKRVLSGLPDCDRLSDEAVEKILLEVARRGIPTVRGLSGDNTGATGDLGLFVAVRLLQDQFRSEGNLSSLLPVIGGTPDDASIAIIVPIDPFRGYLADMARSFGKDASLSRPDLLVIGVRVADGNVRVRLTPVEVKCRQGGVLSASEATDALAQSRALAGLFQAIAVRGRKSAVWLLAYQHLLLSMIGFGLRVYSQHGVVGERAALWAEYHEAIAAAILCSDPAIGVDDTGRLIVIDNSGASDCRDWDGDGYPESVVISSKDAGRIVAGDAQSFYEAVRAKVGDWRLLPPVEDGRRGPDEPVHPTAGDSDRSSAVKADTELGSEDVSDPALDPSGTSTSSPIVEATSSSDVCCAGIQLSVGRTVDGFEPRPLSLNVSDTRLNQLNLGVVGDLGTGKTQLLKSLIYQIAGSTEGNRGIKPRVLIFDYKRDYSSEDFVAATGARVVEPTRLPLNLFDTSAMGKSAAPWLDRFRFFADVLDKVYSGIGPVQRDKLKGAVRSAYETCGAQGRAPTIYDVHAEYKALLGGKSDSPMAIIDDLVDMEVFARDPKDALPFDQFLDGVVVVSLDALGQDDRSKNMLVAVMLNMFYENMLKTPKRPFLGTDPQLRVIDSYLLVDEADNIMRYEFDVLRKLLLQGREFGVGVILASQYLRHFKVGATDYREPLLTWCIHKVPNATPAELGALGFTSDLGELSERVKSLPNHHCLYKSFDIPGEVVRGLPFYELMQNLKLKQ
jgi:DNA phosphorothioation-dependent restriction protein DptH